MNKTISFDIKYVLNNRKYIAKYACDYLYRNVLNGNIQVNEGDMFCVSILSKTKTEKKECVCQINDLMIRGCKCGAI